MNHIKNGCENQKSYVNWLGRLKWLKGLGGTILGQAIQFLLPASLFTLIIHKFTDFIFAHHIIFEFLFCIGWVLAVIFFLKIVKFRKNSFKKLINGIAVDKQGECYCPVHFQLLHIKNKLIGNTTFSEFKCDKCETVYKPRDKSGNSISAQEFYAFQKDNPQMIYTKKQP